MNEKKRVSTATLLGVIFGIVNYRIGVVETGDIPWPVMAQAILTFALLGFAIGISTLKLSHWSIHGITMGAIFSLPLSCSGLMASNPELNQTVVFTKITGFGIVSGLLIELIVSQVLKAKAEAAGEINMRRTLITTITGLFCGAIAAGIAIAEPDPIPDSSIYETIITFATLGFVIGISGLRTFHWSLHGSVIGAVISLPLALTGLMAGDYALGSTGIILITVGLGAVSGLLAETVSSKMFKAGLQ